MDSLPKGIGDGFVGFHGFGGFNLSDMDSLPKGIGDRFSWIVMVPPLWFGPTWTHCRKALVT